MSSAHAHDADEDDHLLCPLINPTISPHSLVRYFAGSPLLQYFWNKIEEQKKTYNILQISFAIPFHELGYTACLFCEIKGFSV